ncbi:MAG: cation transporter [Pseudomonadota bacterium]|nr:cation transporter [Pseudomonadota bacterium]
MLRSVLMLTAFVAIVPAFAAAPQTVVLDVQNMTCSLCPITVRKSLEQVPGVSSVKVDLDTMTATVRFDQDKAAPATLVKATTNAGFPSTVRK